MNKTQQYLSVILLFMLMPILNACSVAESALSKATDFGPFSSGTPLATTAGVLGAAYVINFDELPQDALASYRTGMDCNTIRQQEDGGPYCRAKGGRNIVEKPYVCQKSLAGTQCFHQLKIARNINSRGKGSSRKINDFIDNIETFDKDIETLQEEEMLRIHKRSQDEKLTTQDNK